MKSQARWNKIYQKQQKRLEDFGFSSGSISACCKGYRKSHKGFVWRYV